MKTVGDLRINASERRSVVILMLWAGGWMVLLSPLIPDQVFGQEDQSFEDLAVVYQHEVLPLLKQFCTDCHSTQEKEGELDLERFGQFRYVRMDPAVWQKVDDMLRMKEMPPADSTQPSPSQFRMLRNWVSGYLNTEARAQAGDPGPVVLRRLNNAEYTYTLRELTQISTLDPAREFPSDGAAGEGFTNTGNALVMSPALFRKYLDAAQETARHVVLLPQGFRFSPYQTRRDWTDELLAKIRSFYSRYSQTIILGAGKEVGNKNVHSDLRIGKTGQLPLKEYFIATIAERDALASGSRTFVDVAQERGLSTRYLKTLWKALTSQIPSDLMDDLRARWHEATVKEVSVLINEVTSWQRGLWTFGPVGLIGRTGGPTRWMEPKDPLVSSQELRFPIPKRTDNEDEEDVIFYLVLTDAGDGNEHDHVRFQQPRLVAEDMPDILLEDIEGLDVALLFSKFSRNQKTGPDSFSASAPAVIPIQIPAHIASGREFVTTMVLSDESVNRGSVQVEVTSGEPDCLSPGLLPSECVVDFSTVTQVFSDSRAVSFLRPIVVGEKSDTRMRFLRSMEEHRSLFPAAICYTQIVPIDEVLTLTLFYREDDHFVRLMLDERERTELDHLWDEFHYVSHSALLHADALELLLETMSSNLNKGPNELVQYKSMKPLSEPFMDRAELFRKTLIENEAPQLESLIAFATRAYRRPLEKHEAKGLLILYQTLRKEEVPHEEAFRLTLVRVLTAPEFLYRLEDRRLLVASFANSSSSDQPSSHPVSNHELASRLSYFLWSTMPDDRLRADADALQLVDTDRLLGHARRMLKDDRIRRLAIEFACQWLQIREFDQLDEKSEVHFPRFAELRADMYEESILFFTDLFQSDRSILSIIDADHVFVNASLAEHYGIKGVRGSEWRRVDRVHQYQRGGILGQATFLSRQSGASRSNPILRGNFIFETLLGNRMPRPPKEVPELPGSIPNGLSERAMFEQHTTVAACAKCHDRIDPYGFVLDSFDAIGRFRDTDSTGHKIDTQTTLEDGTQIEGLDGLREYLLKDRRDSFVYQFCKKLLGYALGRAVQLSDKSLIDEMMLRLSENDYHFSVLIETIVSSDQFREIRGKPMHKES